MFRDAKCILEVGGVVNKEPHVFVGNYKEKSKQWKVATWSMVEKTESTDFFPFTICSFFNLACIVKKFDPLLRREILIVPK